MTTYFASAKRTTSDDLKIEINTINKNPVINGLLESISGLLAVLDQNRQIVSLNESFLKILGIQDYEEALGLRPGEALNCMYADNEPGGCGTSKLCSTCGAAIAIVTALSEDHPVERLCALTAKKNGQEVNLALLVRSHPIKINGKRFLLLFVQDISAQQQRNALERVFFHDLNNILGSLVGASEMLYNENRFSNLTTMIYRASLRLKKEIDMQKTLLNREPETYQPLRFEINSNMVLDELKSFFQSHPAAEGKKLDFSESAVSIPLKTDLSLLLRVLSNMVINALEASEDAQTVKIWTEHQNHRIDYCVGNQGIIPDNISRRIFQRNFSTKEGEGRGVGTYSMKLFGEQILGGKVTFSSCKDQGTVFRISLPE